MIDHTLDKSVNGNFSYLITRLNHLDPNTKWQITARPYKSKRSNQQNSRYWAFLTELGAHLGYTRDEMHDLCKYKFLSEQVEVNGESMVKLKSTHKTNTKEFAEYCEACEMWAVSLGFVWGGE